MKLLSAIAILIFAASPVFADDAGKTLFSNNFEKADAGPVPPEFLVLDGEFSVKESEGNKYLELPGAPLDNFGVLFGPTTNSGVCVSARIFGTGKGRRFPQFGVGLDGQNGFKLKVFPAKDTLEIFKGDDSVASVPYRWKSGEWTMFKLQIREADASTWKVEGKAWAQSSAEPAGWVVSFEDKVAPRPGRPSVWGSPVSGTPIRFDDLVLTSN